MDACALGPQSKPAGPVTASNATALAFAPDGRLFFAERTGTVREPGVGFGVPALRAGHLPDGGCSF